MKAEIEKAVSAGIDFLARQQRATGQWEEWDDIPPGASQGFITGYVGMALIDVESRCPRFAARQHVNRAADWLEQGRKRRPGWGWNLNLPSDADSTGYALNLLRAMGRKVPSEDVKWLISLWQPGGGFPSYNPKWRVAGRPAGAWGVAHPDVTPIAFSSLPDHHQRRKRFSFSWNKGFSRKSIAEEYMGYALKIRLPDGSWPNYWWRTRHYSTFWNIETLRQLGWNDVLGPPVVGPAENQDIHTPFDLALVLGISLFGSDRALSRKYGNDLIGQQLPDGSWQGGTNLRIVRQDCYPGETALRGVLYVDTQRVLTTATAVRMLARLAQVTPNGN